MTVLTESRSAYQPPSATSEHFAAEALFVIPDRHANAYLSLGSDLVALEFGARHQ
jgi:hypothetical protein